LRTGYAVADGAAPSPSVHRGFIDAALIRRVVPDFLDRTFYISGPWAMVSQFRRVLKEMGVARSRIKVDFFPGFA
jgi:ferredoxin-NADP reductase